MKKKILYIILFSVLMTMLFLSLAQKEFLHIKIKQLDGVMPNTNKPTLTFETYKNGRFQRELEDYVAANLGFREPIIRLYNQYLWDFYRKTYSKEVAIGKNDWLYFNHSISEYYGTEMYRWFGSTQAAIEHFHRQIRMMSRLKNVLNSYNIDFIVFTTPEKSFIYPEFVPEKEFDTTTIHAYDIYNGLFDKYNIPYIDMNAWFASVKDSLDFPLIPQYSAHWTFYSVYAADSLFRFMAEQKGITMPHIKIGERIPISEESQRVLRDLERGLNLVSTLSMSNYDYYEKEVSVESDSNAIKTRGIFIGNSFFRAFKQYIPLSDIFADVKYWFYNMTEFYGDNLQLSRPIEEVDKLREIIDSDYIVWFTNNSQMYKISYGFVEEALIMLCVSDSLWNEEVGRISSSNGISKESAAAMLKHNPELIKGLDVDNPTIRNTGGIAMAREMNRIEKDDDWMKTIKIQSNLQSKSIDEILMEEAKNIKDGNPLLRDNTIISDSLFYEYEVNMIVNEIKSSPEKMKIMREKAKKNNITVEEAIIKDAKWIVDYRNQ